MPTFVDPTPPRSSASSPSASPTLTLVPSAALTPHDVLSGRGPRIQNHPGNRLFRTIVASRRYDYLNAARHKDKQIIAQEIVDYVLGRRGMVYTLGNGVPSTFGRNNSQNNNANGSDNNGGGGGGEKRKGRGEVVVAVEGMGSGGLHPPGRFLELIVEPPKKGSGKGGRPASTATSAATAKGKKKRGGGTGSSSASASDATERERERERERAALQAALRAQGTRRGQNKTAAVVVAHPDLWRPMSDAAACEKVKQAFRNLSKGLISDPKVQSAFVVGRAEGGGGGVGGGSGGGGSSSRSAAGNGNGNGNGNGGRGRRRSSNEMTGGSSGSSGSSGNGNGNGNAHGRRVVAGPAARRQHQMQAHPSGGMYSTPGAAAGAGTVDAVGGGYLAVSTGDCDGSAVGAMVMGIAASAASATSGSHPGGTSGGVSNGGSGGSGGSSGSRAGLDRPGATGGAAAYAAYPPVALQSPGLSAMLLASTGEDDMAMAGINFDDFDANFGSLEDLAESLEMLEGGGGGGGGGEGGGQVQAQAQAQAQEQSVVDGTGAGAVGTAGDGATNGNGGTGTGTSSRRTPGSPLVAALAMNGADFEPNPINYALPPPASATASSSSAPPSTAPSPSAIATSSPMSPPSGSSSCPSSPNPKDTILGTLRQCLEMTRRVKACHASGRTMWPQSSSTAQGMPQMQRRDLVQLGEIMYKAFAGVDPVRQSSSSSVEAIGESSADSSSGGPSKRRSLGALDSGRDATSDGAYVPLRDVGFPTSLCICVSSLLDAANEQCPDRYVAINEVEADLVLMTGKPERYLFDPKPNSSTPARTPTVPMSAASIVNGAIDSSRLSFPTNKLYGRDQQLAELLHIFQHVLVEGGQREFITLTGYAGTGKTALVEQLRKPLASMSGNFICCKFDKLNNTQPMQVIFNAFDAYCKEIAGIGGCSRKTPEIPDMPCYCHVREAVQETLGGNISVLTDLMPNMRHLVDDKVMASGSTDLPGVEALNRFIYFFRMFIRAIASTKTPLVLFLDDLQWADAAALELISTLASDSEVKSMLFVATYREEDVAQDHPLHSELARLRLSGIRINSLSLDNIGGEDLNAYVSDVLNLSPRITRPLAEVVHAKTTGNILFVVEFLRSLNAEGLLRYSARSRRWEWDAEAVQARSVDDNVVGLIMKKMLNLDKDMQWMLKVAACLGSQSNGETLIQLLLSGQRSMTMVSATLDVAVKEGLMAKVGLDYKFPHDQIEQAAYSLVPVEQRPALHLSIGRTLWAYQTADQLGDRLELVVNQLSRGADLISDQNERIRFAELCLVAGRKAKAGSAFLLASTYLLQGTVLLNEDCWTHNYKLCLELHSSCAEAQFATGNHTGISISVNPIMTHGQNLQDKMRAYYTLLRSLGAKGQQSDAVTCGLGLLSALGESLPANPQKQDADSEFQKTENMLKNLNVVDIASGKMLVDTQKASAIKALFLLIRHAHMVNQMLMSIMICRMVQLSILFGVSKESSFAFAAYGTLCSKYVGIDDACLYGKVALSIVERFNAKDVLARVTCVLNDFLIFKEPLQSRLPSLKNAYEIGLQMGDIEWALTDANIYILTAIQSGRNLSVLSSEIQSFMQQMKVYKHHTLIVASLYNRFVTNLIDDTGDPTDLALNSDEFVGMSQEVKRISIVNRGYFLRLWLAYLFGNYQLAADMAERRWEQNKSRPFRSSSLANETFYTGLAAVMMGRKGGAFEMKWKGVALAGRDELKKWMSHSKWNFAHKHFLLSAEIEYYLNNNAEEASKLYDQAIESAKKHGFQSELALAYERTAMLYESNLNQAKALEYYRLAHQAYVEWGGATKARHIYEKTLA